MKLVSKLHMGKAESKFEDWAVAKYKEVVGRLNPCNENNEVDPLRLNEVLTKFAADFAWAITMQEVEINKYNQLERQYDLWQKEKYTECYRILREESGGTGRVPSQTAIEAKVAVMAGEEMTQRRKAVDDQKSKADLLRGLVKVLDRQASVLQTLSSNMRSELYLSGGVFIGGDSDQGRKMSQAKASMKKAFESNKDN